jgi:hypothetical protein
MSDENFRPLSSAFSVSMDFIGNGSGTPEAPYQAKSNGREPRNFYKIKYKLFGGNAIMQSEIKYSGIISRTIPFWGSCFRLAVKIPLGDKMVRMTNRGLGRLLPNLSFLGFRKEKSYENAVWNWEIFLKLIGAEYDAETISPQSKLYNFRKCPAGHCRLEHLDACKVTMELDNSLVESSGGRLIVDKRIPIDGVCVEKIVPK